MSYFWVDPFRPVWYFYEGEGWGMAVADKIYVNLFEIIVNLYDLTANCPTLFHSIWLAKP